MNRKSTNDSFPVFGSGKLRINLILGVGILSACALPAKALPPVLTATIAPDALLQVLPVVPVDWKCTQSRGATGIAPAGSPLTTVVRKYEIPPPKPENETAASSTPPPPGLLTLAVSDFGSAQNPLPPPSTKTEPEDQLALALISGELKERRNHDLTFSASVGKRLYVQVTSRNIKKPDMERILQAFDFRPLMEAQKNLPETPLKQHKVSVPGNPKPHDVVVVEFLNISVDELKPAGNRSWKSDMQITQ